jgi:hypothetical protein
MQDLKFSQHWLWKVLSSGMLRRVVRWKYTDISEEHIASKLTLLATCLHPGFLLDLFFDLENRGDMFLRNIGWLSTDCTALYPRRWCSSTIVMSVIIFNDYYSQESFLFGRSFHSHYSEKRTVFWKVTQCSSERAQHFVGTCRLHLQGQRVNQARTGINKGQAETEDGDHRFLRNIRLSPSFRRPYSS